MPSVVTWLGMSLMLSGTPLDLVAGILLFGHGRDGAGGALIVVNALLVGAMIIRGLPEWLRPPGFAIPVAHLILDLNINTWLGLAALVYALCVREGLAALLLAAGYVAPWIGATFVGVAAKSIAQGEAVRPGPVT